MEKTVEEVEAQLRMAVKALGIIHHSMSQASVLGNDKQREIKLSLNIAAETLILLG